MPEDSSFLIKWEFPHGDAGILSEGEQEECLRDFRMRQELWQAEREVAASPDLPSISVEIPVFKGGWIMPCIESVLNQSSPQWRLYLFWDGGDALSRRVLEIVDRLGSPKIRVIFSENLGIAKARHALSAASSEEYILPVDDDDMLHPGAVESLLTTAQRRPWFGVIRAQRKYINEQGDFVDMEEWFPFEHRHYQFGMVQDLNNHCQPYLLSRRAYDETSGWEGFDDFQQAGEDCDIYLKLEEKGSIELLRIPLYYYRLNERRHSHQLTPAGGYEMWRRLADKTIERIGLPIRRLNDKPPFEYEQLPIIPPDISQMDVVIAFYESDERELDYTLSRVIAAKEYEFVDLKTARSFTQPIDAALFPCDRIALMCVIKEPVDAQLVFRVEDTEAAILVAEGVKEMNISGTDQMGLQTVNFEISNVGTSSASELQSTIELKGDVPFELVVQEPEDGLKLASMRLFRQSPGYSRSMLDKCVKSIKACGVSDDAIHIIEKKQSAAANRNEGYAQTTRPYVCYADDDVEVRNPHALKELLHAMFATNAAVVGPRLVTDIDTIFCADPYFNEKMHPKPRGLGEPVSDQYRYIREVPWLPSTLIIARTEAIRAVGGFDEGYIGSQMEDVDFCLKVRQRDLKCVYVGTVDVVHYNHQRNDNFALNFELFAGRWSDYPELFSSIGDDARYIEQE